MRYLISTGSNLGQRSGHLASALTALQKAGAELIKASAIYETEPWGFESGEAFLNQVLEMDTGISPPKMMDRILEIEHKLGRTRNHANGYESRKIDIDILLIDNLIVREKGLEVPHPRLHERKFVLVPAVEIAPDWKHPVFKQSLLELLRECADKQSVVKV